ncbi:MAG: SPFH domain-containing protein [Sedimentisphaerales bacterium]|jgi:membrane protease subunit (stomatin/prohibitin family)
MALIDRIKFDAPSDDILVWKFPSEELKLGSQLIVNQSQEALFLKGGQVCDIFGPGRHTLTSANLPLINKLVNLPFGGKTPFAAEVWFINKSVKRDLKWGTPSPIPLIDPTYNYPISARAFGRWGLRVQDSRCFVLHIVDSQVMTDSAKILEYFIGEIHQRFSAALAKFITEEKTSIFEINVKLNELSQYSATVISPEFARFGIELINFNVESVTIPDDEKAKFQEVLGRRMEIEQISKVKVGQAYTTMRTFDTLEKAAENPGGGAGALLAGGLGLGVGVGAGVPLGKQLGDSLNATPEGGQDMVTRMQILKRMLDEKLISQEEFDVKKKAILDSV